MEARCLWFKGHGVVVFQEVVFGHEFFGHPEDYEYDSAVVDYNKRMMWVYDGTRVYSWTSSEKIIVPDIVLTHFVEEQLNRRSSTSLYDMIHMSNDFFKRECTTRIPIDMVQAHRKRIIAPIENWIPAAKIQRAWRRCISDPKYVLCRNRLTREFEQLENGHAQFHSSHPGDR